MFGTKPLRSDVRKDEVFRRHGRVRETTKHCQLADVRHGFGKGSLKQLFGAAGIRWRIVVVSTCEAGTWIDALKDDETVVIASSATGVRGADCTGGLRPGAFADAFFGAAMRRSDDLPGAFEAARKRLAEQHAAEPVMVVGAAIAEQLKTLRQRGKGRVVASFDARSDARRQ